MLRLHPPFAMEVFVDNLNLTPFIFSSRTPKQLKKKNEEVLPSFRFKHLSQEGGYTHAES